MPTEADTCRTLVLPKPYAAGWADDQIAEQRCFTDGRIVVQGNRATWRPGKRADYLLRYTRDVVLAVVEAKAAYKQAADGLQQANVKPTDYTAEKVRTLCASASELRARWADAEERSEIIRQLADRGVDFQQVALQAGKPDADPFDLLCHLAFKAPVLTRRERADRVKKRETALINYFGPEARGILNDLLEKCGGDGEPQSSLPTVLKLPALHHHGNPTKSSASSVKV